VNHNFLHDDDFEYIDIDFVGDKNDIGIDIDIGIDTYTTV
jgi:hypothetical protein